MVHLDLFYVHTFMLAGKSYIDYTISKLASHFFISPNFLIDISKFFPAFADVQFTESNFQACPISQWECSISKTCIERRLVCDNMDNCPNKEDEELVFCRRWTCAASMWKCGNNMTCIDKTRVCDNYRDCSDASDEHAELCRAWQCPSSMWQCKDNVTCVARQHVCRGRYLSPWIHCPDDSDESMDVCEEWNCEQGIYARYYTSKMLRVRYRNI